MSLSINRLAASALIFVAGCFGPPPEVADVKCSTVVELEPTRTDILFVIDNSCSMTRKQEELAASLEQFVNTLKNAEIRQDFQVGIVTTGIWQLTAEDKGVPLLWPEESGRLQTRARQDGTQTPKVLRSDSPSFLDDFKAAVRVGNQGSGHETHLEAAWRAVGNVPVGGGETRALIDIPQEEGGNKGFLRDGARLLIITVTDEDDCSERRDRPTVEIGPDYRIDYCDKQQDKLTPVSEYAALFRGLRDSLLRPREVSFAAIAPVGRANREVYRVDDFIIDPDGNQQPGFHNIDCPTSLGVGRRIVDFARLFADVRVNVDSICNSDYQNTLIAFARFVEATNEYELKVPPPDPNLMLIDLVRGDGSVQHCAYRETAPSDPSHGWFEYEPATAETKARVKLRGRCARRPDDKRLEFKLVCAS
ncbi:MAG: hypothetical protein ACK4N5_00845 [Myxococcales bacterium]